MIEPLDAGTRKQLSDRARFGRKQGAAGSHGIAVTSHPIATRTATDVLRAGGNACDAALGASLVQTVVEPHMTTLCGALSMLYFDAATGETTYVNGSMARPAGLTHINPADLGGGRSVAVPGFWAAFEAALARHGSRSKAELVRPAIDLCHEGFEVHPFLYGMAFEQVGSLGRYPEGRAIYFPDNRLIEVGETLRQPGLARTLERLVDEGADYFYRGAFAEKMVDTIQAAGGVLTRDDLAAYEAKWVSPARGTYGGYDIAGSPPPDTGGTHVIEILNLVEQLPLQQWGRPTESADTLYWLMRFCGEVFADGAKHGDPDNGHVPLETILSKDYARIRFDLMRMADPQALDPAKRTHPGSNHVTVVDAAGNVASVLHSVMSLPWSNGLFVDGVPLWAGAYHFLRRLPPAGGRGTCYVAPTIIFKDGVPVLTAGSPSVGLLQNIVQNTINILDFGMDIETSVHEPRFGGPSYGSVLGAPPAYSIEADIDLRLRDEVAARGLPLDVCNPWNFNSGSYEGVHIIEGVGHACADPRRTGLAEAV